MVEIDLKHLPDIIFNFVSAIQRFGLKELENFIVVIFDILWF